MSSQKRAQDAGRMPDHLPQKLSIDCWIWSWITAATPGEPYDDLDRCLREARDRGFNAIRVDAGLNWAFTMDGRPRGTMEFGPWIAGYGWNFSTVNVRGGGRLDVLERLVTLFELAARHDIYVILTSWEYQDSSWFVADPTVRAEVAAVPLENRFMHLARQHDRLLQILKEKGLDRHIAFVEVHNEPEHSEFPKEADTQRRLHYEAIAFLRARHPEILISADFSSQNCAIIPENAQVFDRHIYAGGDWYFQDLYGQTVLNPAFDPLHPRKLEPLRRVLKDGELVPWDDFMRPAQNIRPFWRPIMWMFENLDNMKWGQWVAERFTGWEARIRETAIAQFRDAAADARRYQLPLVFDEGGFFYPPRLSRFEISPKGLAILDLFADLAVEHGYWGFMPGTYCGPEHLIWQENPQWLRHINRRFQQGALGSSRAC